MTNAPAPAPAPRSLRPWIAAVVLLGLVGTGAAWYGLSQRHALNAVAPECRLAKSTADRLKPLATGELAALGVRETPKPPPAIAFLGPDGKETDLTAFHGKTILVNLWATWCVPCRQEMPALDKLQAERGGDDFQVVAINVDTRNADKPKAWLEENGIHNLTYYADPSGKVLQVLQRSGHVVGLPTTLMVDASGCELALLKGPAEWDAPEALAFVASAAAKPEPSSKP